MCAIVNDYPRGQGGGSKGDRNALTTTLEDLKALHARLEIGLARVLARQITPPTHAELDARRKLLCEVAEQITRIEGAVGLRRAWG
jgi:hypothetical protein